MQPDKTPAGGEMVVRLCLDRRPCAVTAAAKMREASICSLGTLVATFSAQHPSLLRIGNHQLGMQEMHAAEQHTPEPRKFSAILAGLKQLTLNTEDLHRCQCIFGASLWSTVRAQPRAQVQASSVTCLMHSEPSIICSLGLLCMSVACLHSAVALPK